MKWISVKDRLPEEDVDVIIRGGIGYLEDGVWYTNTGPDFGRPIQWNVTHWMPLPEPPEDK